MVLTWLRISIVSVTFNLQVSICFFALQTMLVAIGNTLMRLTCGESVCVFYIVLRRLRVNIVAETFMLKVSLLFLYNLQS